MSEVPRGWSPARLGDLLSALLDFRGRTPKKLGMQWGGTIPALSAVNVRQGRIDLSRTPHFGSEELYERWMTMGDPAKDDIVLTMEAPLGNVAQIPDNQRYILSQRVVLLKTHEGINSGFLAHQMRAPDFRERLLARATGTTATGISQARLVELQTLLAPLPEQKRIAEKLDTLLARVDACRERLDRVPGVLKRFRQSVLAAATSGELTREWREQRGRSTVDYELRPLRDLVREPLRNGKSVRDGDGPMVLRLSSLRNGSIDWREAKSGEWGDIDVERFLVEDGDFLVARGNGSRDLVGRGSLVLGAPPRVAFPDTMIRVRPDPNLVVPRFLKLVWDAKGTRSQIELSARTTAGIWKIAQSDLEAVSVPTPALDEQEEVVRRAEELLGFADSLDARCNAVRSSVGRLPPSILAKAFRGELVPQDPTDEPAAEILTRLRTRPASSGNTGKPKRGGTRDLRTKAKAGTNMLTRKDVTPAHLTTILKARGALTAEALWTASQLEIDDFYDQLKDEEARGLLRENCGDVPNAPRLLEPAV